MNSAVSHSNANATLLMVTQDASTSVQHKPKIITSRLGSEPRAITSKLIVTVSLSPRLQEPKLSSVSHCSCMATPATLLQMFCGVSG